MNETPRRKAARLAAERQARMLANIFIIEIVGFTVTIIVELLK